MTSTDLPVEVERARDMARREAELPMQIELRRAGVQQLAQQIDPRVWPASALDSWFEKAGRRDRESLKAWMFSRARKFCAENGIHGGLAKDEDTFFRLTEPALAEHGAGLAAWQNALKAAGKWSS